MLLPMQRHQIVDVTPVILLFLQVVANSCLVDSSNVRVSSVAAPSRLCLRGGSDGDSDVPGEVGAIDFHAALRAARASMQAGQPPENVLDNVDLVLAGEVSFEPVVLPLPGGSVAKGWLGEMDAKIKLHHAVHTKGWEVNTASGRSLLLSEPLPPWICELASRLSVTFGGHQPDECELLALEKGQSVPARKIDCGEMGTVACISLAGSGHLGFSSGSNETVVKLDVGDCLLLRGEAARGLLIGVRADERHISLILRRK
mmetsp:Transcript_78545/g.127439  ORF Transcript_78545/g.127439 Transcript_78545/m.127439 type:complete len:258 (+) Transcript_78545:157-930(+)